MWDEVMTLFELRNALSILCSLDRGDVPFLSDPLWAVFRDDPVHTFPLLTHDAPRVFAAIIGRMPEVKL